MCKVSQLIEYLQGLPPDTDIKVIEMESHSWHDEPVWKDLDIDDYSDNMNVINDCLYLGSGY